MTNLWEQIAKQWRVMTPKINHEELTEKISKHLDTVKETIKTSKPVPSAFAEIFADDDEEDDW